MTMNTFMLVDNGLLGGAAEYAANGENWPEWLVPIYSGKASVAGPLVADIEVAYELNQLDLLMALAHALRPALHISFIDTIMSLTELAQHLKQFIFILHEDGKQQTLRFADCAVLPPLAAVLTPAQSAMITRPLARWRIHARMGKLELLPTADPAQSAVPVPLQLSEQQINDLVDAMEPDHSIAKLQQIRGTKLPGIPAEQYEWARAAHSLWRSAGNTNVLVLHSLTDAAFKTRGEILRRRSLPTLLTQELRAIRKGLNKLTEEIEEARLKRGTTGICNSN